VAREAADLRARLQLTERTQSTLEEEAASLREERDHLPSVELEREGRSSTGSRLPSFLPLCSQLGEELVSEIRVAPFCYRRLYP